MAITQIKNLKQTSTEAKTVHISLQKLLDENREDHFFEYTPSQLTDTQSDYMQAVDIIY